MFRDAVDIDPQLQQIQKAIAMTTNKFDREEGLALLDKADMTFGALLKSMAGQKIQRCFRSQRYGDLAKRTHARWMQMAEREIYGNWESTKHIFLTKQQINDLNKAQAAFDRKNPPEAPMDSDAIPITPGRARDNSLTDVNSSFSREFDLSCYGREYERWYLEPKQKAAIPRTPGGQYTDDSMDDLPLGSEASTSSFGSRNPFSPPERRPRGRPRSRGVANLPRRGRRGRPPRNR